jgi:hypothetical protein
VPITSRVYELLRVKVDKISIVYMIGHMTI